MGSTAVAPRFEIEAPDGAPRFEIEAPRPTATISARPKPSSLAGQVGQWASDLAGDIRYGGGVTAPGRLLQRMGAPGLYSGVSEGAAETMGSLPLGGLRMVRGGAEMAQPGQRWQGTKDVAGGALQASTIPGWFAAPEAGEAVAEAMGAASRAAGPRALALGKTAAEDALSHVPVAGRLVRRPSLMDYVKAARTAPATEYPGAPLPAKPPATFLRANRPTYPGAPLPATPAPEMLNPALASEARTLPGQVGAERIFGPRPMPATPIPPRRGLMLAGETAAPAARTKLIEQMGGKPVETITAPRSSWPPEAPSTPRQGGPRTRADILEDRAIEERVRTASESEDAQRLGQSSREWFSRNAPAETKGSLVEQMGGAGEKPVRYTKTPGVKAQPPAGTTVPQTSEEMQGALKESLRQARKKR